MKNHSYKNHRKRSYFSSVNWYYPFKVDSEKSDLLKEFNTRGLVKPANKSQTLNRYGGEMEKETVHFEGSKLDILLDHDEVWYSEVGARSSQWFVRTITLRIFKITGDD